MLHITIAVLLALACACPAQAGLLYKIDFETGPPDNCVLDGATVTDAPGSILGGAKSLLSDFSKAGDGWHEFLKTNDKIRLEAGNSYHVSFHYRIIDSGTPKTRFYSMLRSRSGGDQNGEFWLWNNRTGAQGIIHRLFHIDKKDDWDLILGVRHQGSILIDDIEISVCEKNLPGLGVPAKSGKTDLPDRKAALDRTRASEGMQPTLADMLIVWCNEGAGAKITNSSAQYARQLNPDFVDWNSCGPMATEFGVRTSDGGPEYQEFYKMEGPEIWNARYERFENNGFAESLDGTLIQDETWGEGGYFTCHNGDGWHRWFTEELLRRNGKYLAMCQDNIGCPPFYKGHGCFCRPCTQKFREWLRPRYSVKELAGLGIADLDTFDFRDRVLDYDLTGPRALDDPIAREYIKFQFCSQLAAWADVVERVKLDGKKRGFPVPCYGNQFGGYGSQPFAVALGQFCDVIQIEEYIRVKDSIPNGSLYYKMGRAGGQETKPVWVRGPVLAKKDRAPELSPLFWETHLAEALANGGVRDISFGVNAPWTGDPSTLDYIDSPEVVNVWKDYSALCDGNRAVFTRRKSLAKVALVYSLPSTMFRRFYPLNIDDGDVFRRFDETSAWLDSLHVPYDCIIFGHPEFFATAAAQLERYSVLVLPAADALSDIQVSLLKQFVARGGKLLAIGDLGTRDENLNLRLVPSPLAGARIVDLASHRDEAAGILRNASLVITDAPKDVTVNAWLSANGSSLDIHLVNYGADLSNGTWNAGKPIKLDVALPSGFRFDAARLLQFGKPSQELKYSVRGSRVSITVPSLRAYAVLSLCNKAKLDAENAAAKQRREQDKANVKQLARDKGLY